MELMCAEKITEDSCHALRDLNVFEDERVLRDLLSTEHLYVPHCNYFDDVQTDVKPFMRKMVTQWMVEVCDVLNCEDQVLPLAVNMFDRYLCTSDTPKNYLQRVAANCILMASKIRQATISVDTLCKYTNYSVTPCEMRAQELLLVEKLEWDLLAVTGFDFVDHILHRIRTNRHDQMIRRHSMILLHLCYTEFEFMQVKPSTIATACVISAIRGLKIKVDCRIFRNMCSLTNSSMECVKEAVDRLEWIVAQEEAATITSLKSAPVGCPASNVDKMINANAASDTEERCQRLTPTDVQDVEF